MAISEKRKAQAREWRKNNPEKIQAIRARYREKLLATRGAEVAAYHSAYGRANRAAAKERELRFREKHPERVKAAAARYRAKHPAKKNAETAYRRALRRQRTPVWADRRDLESAYELAVVLSRSGLEYHVDHEIPLRGRLVSGLHVPENLKVVPWYVNLQKGNRFTGEQA